MDQVQAGDLKLAIGDTVALHSDVYLYRKIGSRFLCIGLSQVAVYPCGFWNTLKLKPKRSEFF